MFFFSSRRRHTRLQGDWSSDVCSSDLGKRSSWESWDSCCPPLPRPRPGASSPHRGNRRAATCSSSPTFPWAAPSTDRKSTRLNSSHLVISYAVFCLKKKKKYISPNIRYSYHFVYLCIIYY